MIWRCIFNDILSSMRSQCKGIDPLWLLPTHDKSYESFEYQDEFKKIYIVRKVYYAYKERMKDILIWIWIQEKPNIYCKLDLVVWIQNSIVSYSSWCLFVHNARYYLRTWFTLIRGQCGRWDLTRYHILKMSSHLEWQPREILI